MITEEQSESIISELVSDGMRKSEAERRVNIFNEWFTDFTEGIRKVAAREYAQYWIDEIIFPAGYGTTIFARQGMGKTNLLVYMMESAAILHNNWVFLHNVPFPSAIKELMAPRFREIRSAKEMMLGIIDVLHQKLIPVVVLDEFDSVYNATNVNSKQGKSWTAFVWRQRHFSVRGPLMAYHALNSIPRAIRNRMVGGEILWFHGKGSERLISNPDLPWCTRIRRAYIPYLSHGSVGFEIDIDFSSLLNRVSGTQEEVINQIEEELINEEGGISLAKQRSINNEEAINQKVLKQHRKELKKRIIEEGIKLRAEGLTNPQIANELRSLFPEVDFITPEWVRRNIPSGKRA